MHLKRLSEATWARSPLCMVNGYSDNMDIQIRGGIGSNSHIFECVRVFLEGNYSVD